jgi:hypothetical protein
VFGQIYGFWGSLSIVHRTLFTPCNPLSLTNKLISIPEKESRKKSQGKRAKTKLKVSSRKPQIGSLNMENQ